MNDRKQQVLLTAQRLFAENGFAATSVQDILDASSISKGTFYNYFSTKNTCLIEILERAGDEATVRRLELLIGQNISDEKILAEQISIRMQVSREYNLLPLFEAIFHSGDPELKEFIVKHHVKELSWLTNRFVDVYGKDAAPYAPDCAVLMLGMMQHMSHVWAARSEKEIDTLKLVHFAMRRISSIITDMIATNDVFLGENAFFKSASFDMNTKHRLLAQLTDFYNNLDENTKGKQYLQFLLEEILSEQPRYFLLESVVHSFQTAFINTPYEIEASEHASTILSYAETLHNEEK